MGGDFAPDATLQGAREALEAWPGLCLLLVGDDAVIRPLLPRYGFTPELLARAELVHASQTVVMEDKATSILKEKKDSSIRVAAQLVREGRAHGVVSMGHTGAAMVASSLVIGKLEGVDRPALASVLPNMMGRPTVLLDVGANVDSRAEHIAQFAVMGSVYAEEVLGLERPRVGILSVGEEDGKGTDVTKEASAMLRQMDIRFEGNAEGRDIWNGNFDVIACDGFVGNVVLKSSEALAEGIISGLRESFMQSALTKFAGLLAKPAMKSFKKKLDYSEYGGAPLLGVKGVSIIGHGRSDAKAVRNAIRAALRAAEHRLHERIQERVALLLPQD
ncbi:MAG: phosphate acyltransferase PlsX [Holophagaceae bacterium]|uniref:Phosphate acyltransferase n=1 Tax=Candidatus Geothrix skivensis TaxID=2954439 RepID=A0A9D7SH23_9BACT|nr:phosphate acyltransferase PlsX [Candidatus Geothrix skivensis]